MSVKEGYKQTELGVIPKDWRIINLDKNFSLKARIGWQGLTVAEYLDDGDFYLVTGTDFKDGKIDWDNCVYVDKGRYIQDTNIQLKANDVLITKDGTIGKVAFITDLDKPTTLNSGVFVLRPKFGDIDEKFLFYLLRSFYFDDFLRRITAGSTITHLYQKDFVNFNLVLPSKPEQEKIAKALSDTDAYIVSLEKLIAKKQLIKEGLMTNLLTGKERLAEFAYREDGTKKGYKESELGLIPEDWDVKTVFELADYNKNLFNDGDWIEAEYITDKGIRLIQTGNIGVGKYIETKVKKYISEYSFNFLRCKELKEGDLLICRLAEPAGRACIFEALEKSKTITSVDVTIFRPSTEKVNRDFYLYYFSYPKWFDSIQEHVGGTTHKRISRNSLGKISVVYPGLKEQTEIAKIIKTLTSEIDELEKKLKKTQFIKQGMMQKLLTGEIRLINPPTQP